MKTLTTIAVLLLSLTVFAAVPFAASNKCSVTEVDGKKLVLECERNNNQFEAGDQVKIKSVKKGAAVEGC